MPEFPDRLCDNELSRRPAANAYKLYYTATSAAYFGMGVANTTTGDLHVSVFLIPAAEVGWSEPSAPPPYTEIVSRKLIEADATQSEPWEMPNCVLRSGDKIAVFTDVVGANFNGHGIRITGDPVP